jgi:methylated-DNA-[protein]-cysteine S-methyltransferase
MAGAIGWCVFDTPVGGCTVAWTADSHVSAMHLPEAGGSAPRHRMQRRLGAAAEKPPPPAVAQVIQRLQAALQGAPDTLADVPLDDSGLPVFHRRVYALAQAIPPGQTRSYGELAAALGEPGAARAVGQALGRNPFAPLVPCHRVLAAGHRAGGFSAPGGLDTKLRLLLLEGAELGGQPGLF